MLKKLLSISLAVTLLLNIMIISLNVSSLEADSTTKVGLEETNVILNNELNLDYIVPITEGSKTTYYDQNNNVVDITESNDLESVDEDTLPETFDLRDEGRLTSVKDQGTEGFCWSFASMASMESNVLSTPELRAQLGENPQENLDFSEVGIPWYVCTGIEDESSPFYGDHRIDDSKGSDGGNTEMTAMGLSSGFGVHPEELFPYSSWGQTYSEAFRFYSDYRLKEYAIFENNPALIKSRLMEYGAVCTTFNSYQTNYYYNDDNMQSYYDNGESLDSEHIPLTHVVVIVGWDDNFSKDNFNPLMRPENDGAWLCKNSWGENSSSHAEGYEGFFWISYETDIYNISQFVAQSTDKFDNIYQHQLTSTYSTEVTSAANIFTAERDEIIKQICYANTISSDSTIEIYKLNENYSSPEDGILLTSFDGSTKYPGTHTFEVPGKVELKTGDIFSVVIKGDEPVDINVKYLEEPKENKSLFKTDDQWLDAANYDIGYFVIKAYTSNKDNVVYKDKLETAIHKTEYLKNNLDLAPNFISELEKLISDAKYVLNDTSATQNKVDNMVCHLENIEEKCNYAYYEINTIEDYIYLQKASRNFQYEHAKIVLNKDLDFSNKPMLLPLFTEKNAFNGEFDGKGHTISNLNNNYYTYCGLFGEIENAVIQNLELKNCSFNSSMNAGAIAGKSINSTISDCIVTGTTVISNQSYAGGIIGFGEETVVRNCSIKDSNVTSTSETASGIIGSCFGSDIHNCSITNTEIVGYLSANLYTTQETYDCSYDNVTVKSFYRVSLDSDKILYNNHCLNNCYSFIIFEDDKFTIQPYLGEISGVSSDEATVTKVDTFYEVTINEGFDSVYLYIEYFPLNTNNFSFTFDIITNTITLDSYYNGTDETITEVVFPSYIGNLPVTYISYLFDFDSISPIKSIVFPETIDTINDSIVLACYDLEKVTIPVSITTIDSYAFSGCSKLTDVYYEGTQEQWNKIDIGARNDNLLNANIHFASTPSTDPVEPKYEIGDVNKDGYVNINDTTLIQKYVAKFLELDSEQLILADVNMDNNVNIKDATYIQTKIAHLI